MSRLCLRLLSIPTAPREAITHASNVLVNLAIASWTSSGMWPPTISDYTATAGSVDVSTTSAPERFEIQYQRQSVASTEIISSVLPEQERSKEYYYSREAVASMFLSRVFFGAGGHSTEHALSDMDVPFDDRVAVLLVEFCPLPAASVLAVCRALLHIVCPPVLLASCEGTREDLSLIGESRANGAQVNLLMGPVLREILRLCGAGSGLQLRFYALQVRSSSKGLV